MSRLAATLLIIHFEATALLSSPRLLLVRLYFHCWCTRGEQAFWTPPFTRFHALETLHKCNANRPHSLKTDAMQCDALPHATFLNQCTLTQSSSSSGRQTRVQKGVQWKKERKKSSLYSFVSYIFLESNCAGPTKSSMFLLIKLRLPVPSN